LRPEATRVKAEPAALEGSGTHALLVYPSSRFYDGRGADRAWLQEAPDPMTQVTWDGWVEIPNATAAKLGVARGDLVTLTSPHGRVDLPAYPVEALHPEAVAVALGQGHAYPGDYARSRGLNTGANPLALLQSAVLMLHHIGESTAANRIHTAIIKVLGSGPEHRTRDIGGTGTTSDFTAAMCERLRRGTRADD